MGQVDNRGYNIKEDGTIVRNPSSSKINQMKNKLSSSGDTGGNGNSGNDGKGKWVWLALLIVAAVIIGGVIMNSQDNSDPFSSESSGYSQIEESSSSTPTDDTNQDDEVATVEEESYASDDDTTESYYTFNGSGNITYKNNIYYFQMSLGVSGNNVNGSYIVTNGDNVWVDLSGTVDDNGKAVVYEYKNGRSTSYYFDGYLNSSSFSGKYKTTSRNLVMDFYASSD